MLYTHLYIWDTLNLLQSIINNKILIIIIIIIIIRVYIVPIPGTFFVNIIDNYTSYIATKNRIQLLMFLHVAAYINSYMRNEFIIFKTE